MTRGWLIVFAKAPRPGLVKTRMSPPLSLDQSAELYAAMLADVLNASAEHAVRLDLLPVLAFHPPEAVGGLIGRVPPGFRLQPQHGDDLGQRMANAFAEAAASGAERILLRGSDSPSLEGSVLEEAMDRLDAGDDVVLTPDQGGGYVLIGMRGPHPELFDVGMSTRDMLEETIRIARSLGLRSSLTPPALDLDTVADLRSLLMLDPARRSDLYPLTVELISSLGLDIVL